MTKREKVLGWIFGLMFVLIVGSAVTVAGVRKISGMRAQSDRLTERVEELETLIATRAQWEQRSEWVASNVPNFETRGKASSDLIARVDVTAAQSGVRIGSKELIEAPLEEDEEFEGSFFESAGLNVAVTGDAESVVKWIHSLQQPNDFVGVKALKIEPDSETGSLRCEAEVRLWYGSE